MSHQPARLASDRRSNTEQRMGSESADRDATPSSNTPGLQLATLRRYYVQLLIGASAAFLCLLFFHSGSLQFGNSGVWFPLQLLSILAAFGIVNKYASRLNVVFCVLVAISLRFLFCWVFQPTPASDFSALWNDAIRAAEQPYLIFHSKSPLVIIYYGAIAQLLDARMWAVYVANSLVGGLQTFLVFKIVSTLEPTKRERALNCSLLFAVFPSLVYYTALVSSEFVFLTFFLIALWQYSQYLTRGTDATKSRTALLFGVTWGAVILSRNIAVLFVPVILGSLLFAHGRSLKRKIAHICLATLAIIATLIPQGIYNYSERGKFSLLSHPRSSIVLLFGTSRETNGKYNLEEIKRIERDYGISYSYSNVSAEFEAVARKISWDRILGDPWGFLLFAVRDKFPHIWGSDSVINFVLKNSAPFQSWSKDVRPNPGSLDNLATNFYLGVWLVVAWGLFRTRAVGLFPLVALHLILITAGVHLIYEVQPRYHLGALPLAVLLIGTLSSGATASDVRRFNRRHAKIALFPVVTLLAAVGLTEVFFRAVDPLGIEYVFATKQYFSLMEPNDQFAYRHRPNLDVALQGVQIRTNSEGFRGPEFSIQKPLGKKRLLLLGDSVVFSWGVNSSDSLPSQLQRLFDESGREVEVVNAAVGSWNTRTEREFMRVRGFDYQPDIVVQVVVNNDIQPKRAGKTSVPADRLFEGFDAKRGAFRSVYEAAVGRSYALSAIQRVFTVKNQTDEYLRSFAKGSPRRADVTDAFTNFAADVQQHKVRLIGFLYGEGSSAVGQEYRSFYTELFQQNGVPLHEFPAELYGSAFRNSMVDEHRNASGLSLMAKNIYDTLVQGAYFDELAAPRESH